MDASETPELHRLLSGLLDDTLGPDGQARLGELLRASADACDLALTYCDLDAGLVLVAGPGPAPAGRPPAGRPPAGRGRARPRWAAWVLAASALIGAGGVGVGLHAAGGRVAYADVRGAVCLDGRAVADGSISFEPVDGQAPTAGAVIKDGRFVLRIPVATHRVRISSPAPLPAGADPETYSPADRIAERYNIRTELTLRVAGGGADVVFDLKGT